LGASAAEFSRELKSHGVLANPITETHMRLVTHMDVSRDQCERAADVIAELTARRSMAAPL